MIVKSCLVGIEDVMEPNLGDWITFLRIPWIYGLGLSTDKAPVDGTNILLKEEGDVSLESGPDRSCHIFRTNCRSAILEHLLYSVVSILWK